MSKYAKETIPLREFGTVYSNTLSPYYAQWKNEILSLREFAQQKDVNSSFCISDNQSVFFDHGCEDNDSKQEILAKNMENSNVLNTNQNTINEEFVCAMEDVSIHNSDDQLMNEEE